MSFPISPTEGQTYNEYVYESGLWNKYNKQKEWAFLGTPKAFVSAYKNSFVVGSSHGKSLELLADKTGIKILEDGVYEVKAVHRVSEANNNRYIGIALNGDRYLLADRGTGVWHHSHNDTYQAYTESYYLGTLSTNEIITVGPATSADVVSLKYGTTAINYNGTLKIRRIS